MIKKIFFLLILIPTTTTAQKQGSFWYFGDHAGLDFSSGIPVPLTNGATFFDPIFCQSEGSAVISDSVGELLFYTNGEQIWNKNHSIMPNGDSLLGNSSSTQSALIIPQPASSRYFYVFTTDDFCNDTLKYGLRYSIVDICLKNGLGDVMPNQKNIKLLDTIAEKLTAVRHLNGEDYWVITHKYFSDAFYSFHLSSSGISDTVISHVGSVHPFDVGFGSAIGVLKASPNGQKLAIVTGNSSHSIAEYFDFDKGTGVVSNSVSIATNSHHYYGASFSPDNSKLYIASWLNGRGIFQFDLNAGGGNPTSVEASRIQITSNLYAYAGLQLAIDGKIYATRNNGYSQTALSVINSPNNAGLSCNYVDSAIHLSGGIAYMGLPNFIDSYDYSNNMENCNIVEIQDLYDLNNDLKIYPNPANNNIIAETTLSGRVSYSIYDARGRQLQAGYFNDYLNIDISTYVKGLYLLQLNNSKVIVTRKFVKD